MLQQDIFDGAIVAILAAAILAETLKNPATEERIAANGLELG